MFVSVTAMSLTLKSRGTTSARVRHGYSLSMGTVPAVLLAEKLNCDAVCSLHARVFQFLRRSGVREGSNPWRRDWCNALCDAVGGGGE